MNGSTKVICIRSAMKRKLADLNLRSILDPRYETAKERYFLEVSIRKIEGIETVCYWRLELGGFPMNEFCRSLRGWCSGHPKYSAWVKIVHMDIDPPLIEAPFQLASSLDQWLRNYWGMPDVRLLASPDRGVLASSCRVGVT